MSFTVKSRATTSSRSIGGPFTVHSLREEPPAPQDGSNGQASLVSRFSFYCDHVRPRRDRALGSAEHHLGASSSSEERANENRQEWPAIR
jgi:hypothetical protein